MKKKTSVKLLCLTLALLSLSSCQSFKRKLAGDLTDHGISMDSLGTGAVYLPANTSAPTEPSPYDTVYENCLFVGNSIMCDFYESMTKWQKEQPKLFEKVNFFCNENFSVYENNYSNPNYASSIFPTINVKDEMTGDPKDVKCTVETAVEHYGAELVVFCLAGINDLPVYGDEENCHVKAASEMGRLIKNLKNKFPDVSIVVLSAPPISSEATPMKSINNEKIKGLNEELLRVCTGNSADFIDMTSIFSDENGSLKKEFCADNYCKLTEDGCKAILASLRFYASKRKGEL
ncbi:MAG: hypothetical protein E7614_01825 [Ruminococcaceae bacterium]|nr:hypothetical protein [Oscillospiraceae bacterium]